MKTTMKKTTRKKSNRRGSGRAAGTARVLKVRKRAAATARPGLRPVPRQVGALRAADLMTREPITVPQDMTLAELCDLFQERNINGAPVVDERGQLVGVVAQDDIIYGAMGRPIDGTGESPARRRRRGMVEALRERSQKTGEGKLRAVPDALPRGGERAFWADMRADDDPMRMPVRSIMTSPAISAEEKTPITDLCNVMWNLRIHRVPIVRGGKVTGLISSMDLCRAILNGQIKV